LKIDDDDNRTVLPRGINRGKQTQIIATGGAITNTAGLKGGNMRKKQDSIKIILVRNKKGVQLFAYDNTPDDMEEYTARREIIQEDVRRGEAELIYDGELNSIIGIVPLVRQATQD